MFSALVFVFKISLVSVLIYFAIAATLVFSQKPSIFTGDGLDFSRSSDSDLSNSPILTYSTRDGSVLQYRRYGNSSGPLIVILHGSSAHGGLYEKLARGLKNLGNVIVPDLRGHGAQSPAGDVEYIGQLEDDLADLIFATRLNEEQKIILIGHSSGGGLAIRYCGNEDQPKPDGVVLLAPYLGFNAPTVRVNSGGWAEPLVRRIIGLTMLNAVKVKLFNHLPVISFRIPQNAEELSMTSSYSFRMNTSFAPRYDFKKDLAGLPKFKILIGENDEIFEPEKFEPLLLSQHLNGTVRIINGLSHLDVIGDGSVHNEIEKYVASISH